MDIAEDREKFWEDVGEKFYKKNLTIAKYRTPFIANIVKRNNIKSVLELGCNSGRNLKAIYEQCPDVKVVGVDICEEAIKYAQEVDNNKAEFIIGSLYDLSDFEDDSFDLVFTSSVLFHIPSDKAPGIIAEQKRIARGFIFNIECHGSDGKVIVKREGTPHQWSTDYIKIYKNLGLKPKIEDMLKVLPKQKTGSATHIISAGLDGRELIY
jgi:SAM-dependent methyltransferase